MQKPMKWSDIFFQSPSELGKNARRAETIAQEHANVILPYISRPCMLDAIEPKALCYLVDHDNAVKYYEPLRKSKVFLIVQGGVAMPIPSLPMSLVSCDAQVTFIVLSNMFYAERPPARIEKGIDCQIDSTAVVGAPGMNRLYRGTRFYDMKQVGGVRIGMNVKVGALSVITRGTLHDTVIGDYAWIGHLCNVGHNVRIGPHTLLTASVNVGGGARIGHGCFIGMGATINNKVRIPDQVLIGANAVVTKSIEREGAIYAGNPARYVRDWNGDWSTNALKAAAAADVPSVPRYGIRDRLCEAVRRRLFPQESGIAY